ncbi:hypothetical protein LIER_16581 [Lithospermum erythrorhizon]|uniref:Integrase zinc-binding domain-containing protein n=1 Tax=Lithospermum erythrorhizon TaxID=34254 RepID=A0AAV3Q781_LITER
MPPTDWMQLLIDYLHHGRLPEDLQKRVDIRRRAPRFLYYNDTLFRRSFRKILLRCLSNVEEAQAMSEPHYGVCGVHQSRAKLHFQIKRMGYYWPAMVKDCMDYARSCKPFHFHVNFIHQPLEPLHPTIVSWQFDSWGVDMVRPMPESRKDTST